jgi:RNA polymerase primary sigma factor
VSEAATTPGRELVRAAQTGDAGAREQLIEELLPRIEALARRYDRPGVERQELVQEGVLGLLSALRTYDPDRGTPFWAYARPHVARAMQRLVGELRRPVTLSRRALQDLSRLRSAEYELMTELKREPTRRELAERTGLSPDRIAELQAADRPFRSTEEPARVDDATGAVGKFEDRLADPRAEEEYEHVLDRIEAEQLLTLLTGLSEREREVLRWREVDELSPQEISERLGVSEARVRQIERRALAKLRAAG